MLYSVRLRCVFSNQLNKVPEYSSQIFLQKASAFLYLCEMPKMMLLEMLKWPKCVNHIYKNNLKFRNLNGVVSMSFPSPAVVRQQGRGRAVQSSHPFNPLLKVRSWLFFCWEIDCDHKHIPFHIYHQIIM